MWNVTVRGTMNCVARCLKMMVAVSSTVLPTAPVTAQSVAVLSGRVRVEAGGTPVPVTVPGTGLGLVTADSGRAFTFYFDLDMPQP